MGRARRAGEDGGQQECVMGALQEGESRLGGPVSCVCVCACRVGGSWNQKCSVTVTVAFSVPDWLFLVSLGSVSWSLSRVKQMVAAVGSLTQKQKRKGGKPSSVVEDVDQKERVGKGRREGRRWWMVGVKPTREKPTVS